MANQEHLDILKQGVEVWNQWRIASPNIQPDLIRVNFSLDNINLSSANLSDANLFRALLIFANLSSANLFRANLSDAGLDYANLSKANLNSANLFRADLRHANLRGADLSYANLRGANFSNANLSDANLSHTTLVGTNFEAATLINCNIYGIAAWNVQLEGAMQNNLVITPEKEPTITVDNLEVAQFIYLLLNTAKIRDVINTLTTKAVLILGRFTPERKAILDTIRDELRKNDYLPILFDFDKPTSRDTHETITTLARLARFVIADITNPKSIPQELVTIVETLPSLPIQPLLKGRSKPWGMYDHIKKYPWVLPVYRYSDEASLLEALQEKIIAPAEQKAMELNQS